jgi:hypothetical protein
MEDVQLESDPLRPVTRIPPPDEIFNHEYVAACNFALPDGESAELLLRIGGRDFVVLTIKLQDGQYLLIDKIVVHGWRKRPAG